MKQMEVVRKKLILDLDVIFTDMVFRDVIFTDMAFRDVIFTDMVFRDVIFKDVIFRDVIFKDVIPRDKLIARNLCEDEMNHLNICCGDELNLMQKGLFKKPLLMLIMTNHGVVDNAFRTKEVSNINQVMEEEAGNDGVAVARVALRLPRRVNGNQPAQRGKLLKES